MCGTSKLKILLRNFKKGRSKGNKGKQPTEECLQHQVGTFSSEQRADRDILQPGWDLARNVWKTAAEVNFCPGLNMVDNFALLILWTSVLTLYQGENNKISRTETLGRSADEFSRKSKRFTKSTSTSKDMQCTLTGYISEQGNLSCGGIYITFHSWFQNGIADVVRNKLSWDLKPREVYENFQN